MSLEDWLSNRWLHRHETSAEEIQALLHSAEEDIRSAGIEGIAAGWRLNMGYTAACDSVDMISDAEADAALKVAAELGQQDTAWLRENRREFLR